MTGDAARRMVEQLARSNDIAETAAGILQHTSPEEALSLARAISETPEYSTPPANVSLRALVLAVHCSVFGEEYVVPAAPLQDIVLQPGATGAWRTASEILRQAVTICEAAFGHARRRMGACLAGLAAACRALGNYDETDQLLQRSLEAHGAMHNTRPEIFERLFADLSAVNTERGDFTAARNWASAWLETARDVHGERTPEAAVAQLALGRAMQSMGDFNAAGEHIRLALVTLQPPGQVPHPKTPKALLAFGRFLTERGEFSEALRILRRANAMAKEMLAEADPTASDTIEALADLTVRYGPPVAARPLYWDMLRRAVESFGIEHPRTGAVLVKLAVVDDLLGETETARARLEDALAIQQMRLGFRHLALATTLELLGDIELRKGAYAAARRRFEAALAIRRAWLRDGHPETARPVMGLAAIRAAMGDHDQAAVLQQQALSILIAALEPCHLDIAAARDRYAAILVLKGDIDGAEQQIASAVAERQRLLGPPLGRRHLDFSGSLRERGALKAIRGDYAGGAEDFAQAADMIRRAFTETHPDLAVALLGQATSLHASGNSARAMDLVIEALAIEAAHARSEMEWRTFDLAAELFAAQGNDAAAIFLGKQAVNALQGMRSGTEGLEEELRRGFLRARSAVYHGLADRLIRSGRLPEAQQVISMLKIGELREGFRGPLLGSRQPATLSSEEASWKHAIEQQRDGLGRIALAMENVGDGIPALPEHQAELRQLEAEKAGRMAEFAKLVHGVHAPSAVANKAQAATLPNIAQVEIALTNAGLGAVALHYLVMSDRFHIILSSPGKQISREIGIGEADLNREVFLLWSLLRQRQPNFLHQAAKLHSILIGPVVDELRELAARSLVLSLDGSLRYVPFAALHDGSRFLVEDYASMMWAAAAARNLRVPDSKRRVAAFGMSLPANGLTALPHVREELEGIVRTAAAANGILPGAVFLDSAFTRRTLQEALADRYPAVHLATHFVFRPAQELESWLSLGDGSRLTVEDMLSEPFAFEGVELMTLSACETATAAGRREQGREVEGFAAMLISRGVQSVLASLWAVDDLSTAWLMRRFYEFWAEPEGTKIAALRRAQLDLLRTDASAIASGTRKLAMDDEDEPRSEAFRFSHPYHWAPFVLLG
jgi:CHAT domain-containing protein/Tfp pilus assembly protein PilF